MTRYLQEVPRSPVSVVPPTPRRRGRGADPEATRTALLDAAFETLRVEGYAGASARAIAGRAACNQAAIYYHFDGIETLLVGALRRSSDRRLEQYQAELDGVSDVATVAAKVLRLYGQDQASGHLDVFAELMGGVTANHLLRPGIAAATKPWIAFTASVIERVTATASIELAMPAQAAADVLFSLVIGMQVRSRVDPKGNHQMALMQLAAAAASFVVASPSPSLSGSHRPSKPGPARSARPRTR